MIDTIDGSLIKIVVVATQLRSHYPDRHDIYRFQVLSCRLHGAVLLVISLLYLLLVRLEDENYIKSCLVKLNLQNSLGFTGRQNNSIWLYFSPQQSQNFKNFQIFENSVRNHIIDAIYPKPRKFRAFTFFIQERYCTLVL